MSSHKNAVASSSKLPHVHRDKKHHKSKTVDHTEANGGHGTAVFPPNGETHKRDKSSKHREKEKEKSKGKGKSDKTGPFEHRRMRMRLSVPPRFSGDYMAGVKEQLDGMVMHYVPHVQGVLLAHWDHTFLDDTVDLIHECPFGVAEVVFETLIWAPKLGQKLYGSHSLSSPSHLSLLFSRTFNISIPLQHIPLDKYEFQPTNPDEQDEDSSDDSEVEAEEESGTLALDLLKGGQGRVEEVGRWKVRETGKLVGEGGKGVKFTVIGMQVTNQMLSLTGSLLADPTNPPPPPTLPAPTAVRQDSPTPDLEAPPVQSRPAKKPRQDPHIAKLPASVAKLAGTAPSAVAVVDDSKEELDESFLSAREIKKKRKDEQKRKNEARKERRAERELEVEQAIGGRIALDAQGFAEDAGVQDIHADGEVRKRKAGDSEGGKKKKRKEKGA